MAKTEHADVDNSQWKPVATARDHALNWVYKAEHADARGRGETAESCALIALVHAVLAAESAINDLR